MTTSHKTKTTVTERIKDRLTSFLVGLLFTLLTLIAGGVGWLIAQNVYKDAEQDTRISTTENNVAKTARVINKDPDTQKEDRDELRLIYFNTRSGKSEH